MSDTDADTGARREVGPIRDGEPETLTHCYYCAHVFDYSSAPDVPIPSTTLYRCPSCHRWTEA